MTLAFEKCDSNLLSKLLQDSLSEQQEESLRMHLDDCERCRSVLQAQAGEPADWKRIGDVLKEESVVQPGFSSGVRSTLLPVQLSSADQQCRMSAQFQPQDFAVDFLEPSDEPEFIGRLNDIEICSIIGRGANGVVLKGVQAELQRLVAVKVMAPQLATSPAARIRFAREAQATAAIVHPNVMPILTVHSHGQLPYLVMPYVDCESLQQRLDREGQLQLVDILRIGHQVAEGLAAAHAQGLVHRDVKPANILLEKGVDRVMLTDFGLARAVDDGSLTRTGIIAGTPQYMSPEQARGETVDTRSDLFSLGSVLYAMSTGRPPFRAETTFGILRRVTDDEPKSAIAANSAVPIWLDGYIRQLMSKQPDHRPATAEAIAQTLKSCVAHVQQPLTQPLPVAVKRFERRWIDRFGRSTLVAAVAGLLALLMLRPWQQPEDSSVGTTNGQIQQSAGDLNHPAQPKPVLPSDPDAEDASDGVELSSATDLQHWDAGLNNEIDLLSKDAEELLHSIEELSISEPPVR